MPGFDFGVRQNGERVNHVNLPPWARNDPRLFVLIYRQALESEQVSQMLCQWIDLVFGLKQKGKAAIQAINVFHPAVSFYLLGRLWYIYTIWPKVKTWPPLPSHP